MHPHGTTSSGKTDFPRPFRGTGNRHFGGLAHVDIALPCPVWVGRPGMGGKADGAALGRALQKWCRPRSVMHKACISGGHGSVSSRSGCHGSLECPWSPGAEREVWTGLEGFLQTRKVG